MNFKNWLILCITLLGLLGVSVYYELKENTADAYTDVCAYEGTDETYLAVYEVYVLPSGDFHSEDETIAMIEDGKIVGKSPGTVTVSNGCEDIIVHVSDLYTAPMIRMDKEFLPCGRYSQEEAEYLEDVLAYLINEAGYYTRAGAVEACRFMVLRFPYKLHYFYEPGRMSDFDQVDGEGRYYHRGLYLSEADKEKIIQSLDGPAIWGCPMYERENLTYTENGFDCSGFITWAMLNAGYDCGDIGAGPVDDVSDLSDLGEQVSIEDLNVNRLQAGDLVGFDGHIAMIVGIDADNIYVAESYWDGDLQLKAFNKTAFKYDSPWEYVMLMDSFYKQTGRLSNMW